MTRVNVALVAAAAFFCTLLAVRLISPPDGGSSITVPDQLTAADSLPDFWLDWAPTQRPDGVTLVMLFTAECPWCRASVPVWNELATDVRRIAVRANVVGVSLSEPAPTDTFMMESKFEVPIAFPGDRNQFVARWKVAQVPYTVLLSASGEVLGAWSGLVDTTTQSLVLATLQPHP